MAVPLASFYVAADPAGGYRPCRKTWAEFYSTLSTGAVTVSYDSTARSWLRLAIGVLAPLST